MFLSMTCIAMQLLSVVNEGLVRTAANKLIALGLAKAGYKYLNIDGGYK